MSPRRHSRWFIVGLLVAISLSATVVALSLQRSFGAHPALIALGPALAVTGVLILAFVIPPRDEEDE